MLFMIRYRLVIQMTAFLFLMSSCGSAEYAEEKEEEVTHECVDADLMKIIETIHNNHGMDVVVEFFQYKGKTYMDVITAFYSGDENAIDGFFYIGNERVIFRNTDSCNVDLVSECAYYQGALGIEDPPPHEPSQYAYLIEENGDIILIDSVYHDATGRLVVDNGFVDTLSYRKPWPNTVLPPPLPPPPPVPPVEAQGLVNDTVEIFDAVEVAPEFPGGMAQLYQYLGDEIKYPLEAQDYNIQGKVYVQFVVEKDGSISDVNVIKSVHYLLDKEAVRVISSMPPWKPGTQRGKEVRVRYTIPINFTIN